MEIGKTEGIRGYWRGNVPQVRHSDKRRACAANIARSPAANRSRQVLRVLPYSACQLYRHVGQRSRCRGVWLLTTDAHAATQL